ncbi:hypothetical protein [Mycobacterium sp.]|uniref:hypothetical protein n=1 Tax=Mycobacterium sp. TaxID=1785 RepID=UPI003A8AD0BE
MKEYSREIGFEMIIDWSKVKFITINYQEEEIGLTRKKYDLKINGKTSKAKEAEYQINKKTIWVLEIDGITIRSGNYETIKNSYDFYLEEFKEYNNKLKELES